MLCCMFFFFFKQKTAYEMRISDWSSDVCSSDLLATRLQEGLSMAHHAEVDFALLDVNLAGEKSFPIADVLTGRGIPFAFVTGYGRRGVESRYAPVPVVPKPDRKSVGSGKSVSVRVDLGGRRIIKKKKNNIN